MAVAHVASGQGVQQGTSHSGAFTSNAANGATSATFNYTPTGSGNVVLLWVVMVPGSTAPTTCSLSATSWSFAQIGGIVNGAPGGCGAIFSAYAPSTAAASITMTWNQPISSTGGQWFNVLIDEFSGMHTSIPSAGNNSATGSGTPTVSVTPTAANCMIWVPCNDSVTAVGTIGGTTATKGADDTQQDWSEYRLLSGGSGASQSCTMPGSGSYIIGAVAIQPPSTANWKKETYWWQRTTDSSGAF